jgi:hypothetical protein
MPAKKPLKSINMDDMISVADAVRAGHISAKRMYRLCHAGRIPGAVRVGGLWFFPRDQLDKLPPPAKRGRKPMNFRP